MSAEATPPADNMYGGDLFQRNGEDNEHNEDGGNGNDEGSESGNNEGNENRNNAESHNDFTESPNVEATMAMHQNTDIRETVRFRLNNENDKMTNILKCISFAYQFSVSMTRKRATIFEYREQRQNPDNNPSEDISAESKIGITIIARIMDEQEFSAQQTMWQNMLEVPFNTEQRNLLAEFNIIFVHAVRQFSKHATRMCLQLNYIRYILLKESAKHSLEDRNADKFTFPGLNPNNFKGRDRLNPNINNFQKYNSLNASLEYILVCKIWLWAIREILELGVTDVQQTEVLEGCVQTRTDGTAAIDNGGSNMQGAHTEDSQDVVPQAQNAQNAEGREGVILQDQNAEEPQYSQITWKELIVSLIEDTGKALEPFGDLFGVWKTGGRNAQYTLDRLQIIFENSAHEYFASFNHSFNKEQFYNLVVFVSDPNNFFQVQQINDNQEVNRRSAWTRAYENIDLTDPTDNCVGAATLIHKVSKKLPILCNLTSTNWDRICPVMINGHTVPWSVAFEYFNRKVQAIFKILNNNVRSWAQTFVSDMKIWSDIFRCCKMFVDCILGLPHGITIQDKKDWCVNVKTSFKVWQINEYREDDDVLGDPDASTIAALFLELKRKNKLIAFNDAVLDLTAHNANFKIMKNVAERLYTRKKEGAVVMTESAHWVLSSREKYEYVAVNKWTDIENGDFSNETEMVKYLEFQTLVERCEEEKDDTNFEYYLRRLRFESCEEWLRQQEEKERASDVHSQYSSGSEEQHFSEDENEFASEEEAEERRHEGYGDEDDFPGEMDNDEMNRTDDVDFDPNNTSRGNPGLASHNTHETHVESTHDESTHESTHDETVATPQDLHTIKNNLQNAYNALIQWLQPDFERTSDVLIQTLKNISKHENVWKNSVFADDYEIASFVEEKKLEIREYAMIESFTPPSTILAFNLYFRQSSGETPEWKKFTRPYICLCFYTILQADDYNLFESKYADIVRVLLMICYSNDFEELLKLINDSFNFAWSIDQMPGFTQQTMVTFTPEDSIPAQIRDKLITIFNELIQICNEEDMTIEQLRDVWNGVLVSLIQLLILCMDELALSSSNAKLDLVFAQWLFIISLIDSVEMRRKLVLYWDLRPHNNTFTEFFMKKSCEFSFEYEELDAKRWDATLLTKPQQPDIFFNALYLRVHWNCAKVIQEVFGVGYGHRYGQHRLDITQFRSQVYKFVPQEKMNHVPQKNESRKKKSRKQENKEIKKVNQS